MTIQSKASLISIIFSNIVCSDSELLYLMNMASELKALYKNKKCSNTRTLQNSWFSILHSTQTIWTQRHYFSVFLSLFFLSICKPYTLFKLPIFVSITSCKYLTILSVVKKVKALGKSFHNFMVIDDSCFWIVDLQPFWWKVYTFTNQQNTDL